jgi:hypothetical protein
MNNLGLNKTNKITKGYIICGDILAQKHQNFNALLYLPHFASGGMLFLP